MDIPAETALAGATPATAPGDRRHEDRARTAPPETLADADLAQRVAGGHLGAFEVLMRRYNRRLYRIARAALRNDADAEDALQEAWLLAYRRIGQFRGEASLATWLSRLVINECLGRLRRSARRDNVVPIVPLDPGREADAMPSASDTPDRAAARAELRRLLERRLDALPDAFRTVFVLRAVEELSVEETAAALGLPEATVRSRHFRARALLRHGLSREFDLAEQEIYAFGGLHCDRTVEAVLKRLRGQRPAR